MLLHIVKQNIDDAQLYSGDTEIQYDGMKANLASHMVLN